MSDWNNPLPIENFALDLSTFHLDDTFFESSPCREDQALLPYSPFSKPVCEEPVQDKEPFEYEEKDYSKTESEKPPAKTRSSGKNLYINRIQKLASDEKLQRHMEGERRTMTISLSGESASTMPSVPRNLCKRVSGETNDDFLEMKKNRSKDSSKASRQRKKFYTELLEKKAEQLQKENQALSKKLEEASSQQGPMARINENILSQVIGLDSSGVRDKESLQTDLELVYCRLNEKKIISEQIAKRTHGQIIENLLPEHTKLMILLMKSASNENTGELIDKEFRDSFEITPSQNEKIKKMGQDVEEAVKSLKQVLIDFSEGREEVAMRAKSIARKLEGLKGTFSERQLATILKEIFLENKYKISLSALFD